MCNMRNEAGPPRRLAYTWPCGQKCEKLQPFSSIGVMEAAAVRCTCWRSTVHSAISPAENYHKYLPRGPVSSRSTRGALCCFCPSCMRFCEASRNKKRYGWKRFNVLSEKNATETLKHSWRKLTKNTFELGRLNGVFLRGHVHPSYPYIIANFRERRFWDAFVRNNGGGANATRMVASDDLVRSFEKHIAQRLHSPPVVEKRWNQHECSTDGVGSRLSTLLSHGYCPA